MRRLVDHLGGLLPILLLPLGLVGLLVVVSRPDLANQLESWIETQLRSMESPAAQMSLLSLGTFVSEDLTSIGAGILASTGNIALWVAVLGCFLGIFLGDMSLWFVGRLFRPWLNRGRLGVRLGRFGRWLDREGWWAILASRFMPGTRTPLYLAGGACSSRLGPFALWTFCACVLWTPLVVGAAWWFGEDTRRFFAGLGVADWLALVCTVAAMVLAMRILVAMCTRRGRQRWWARLRKIPRFEFWPAAIIYLPLFFWICFLAIRYRSIAVITCANPGSPLGGFTGDSKTDIGDLLPEDCTIPGFAIFGEDPDSRENLFRSLLADRRWGYPLIIKPDDGQRGVGLRCVEDEEQALAYLRGTDSPMIVQPYHPGPHEAGVFYIRRPGEERGRIFSITDKIFPVVIGDGRRTLEGLIWDHPRYSLQTGVFFRRHESDLDRVPGDGERVRLAIAGNHCQGTEFRDGSHLITPELEARIDAFARSIEGFHFGRFDIRYAEIEAFVRGEGLTIVELNGASSESTNIYDPSWPFWRSYAVLFAQWRELFAIAAENRRRGHRPASIFSLIASVFGYYWSRTVDTLAD